MTKGLRLSSTQRNKAFLSLFQPGASHRDAALAYASYQLWVHPLRAGSKQPRLREWQHKATTKFDVIKKWWPEGSKDNIGIYLVPSCVVVIDVDPRNNGDETFEQLCNDHGQLPPTYTVKTAGDGRHYYFRVPADFYYSNTTYPTQIGEGVEFLQNKYVVAPPSELEDGRQYTVTTGDVEQDFAPLPFDWLDEVIRSRLLTRKEAWHEVEDWTFDKGQRNDGATKLAGYFRRIGLSADEIESCLRACGARFENYTEDLQFQQIEIPRIADSIGRHRPAEIRLADVSIQVRQKSYRPEIDIEGPAFQGPIGEFVKYIEPITEAHPAALLAQSLAVFGNLIGGKDKQDPGPGFMAEEGHHKTALYVMVVGESAQGAKGDSWSRVRAFFKHLDSHWRPRTGIQSGEAVINLLADDEELEDTAVIQGVPTKAVKKGASDKRLLVFEPEFARILHVAQRQGSTIKDTLRSLWESGETESIAKSSEQVVTNATFSIVAHITKTDLEAEMPEQDLRNGFGNRFLYIHSERTQFLPSAPAIPSDDLIELLAPLHDALEFAQTAPEDYPFSPAAEEMWNSIGYVWYTQAKRSSGPVEDKMAGRARPAVRRMAIIYAIADCSSKIELQHLEAANALWEYCTASVNYIFGNRIGDPMADKIYRGLIEHAPGLILSEIHTKIFKGNRSAAQIKRALELLVDRGIVMRTQIKRGRKTVDLFQAPHQPYEGEK